MLNQKLDEIRRDLYRNKTEYNTLDLIKGTRWLLLRNKDNLTDKAKERLEEALEINKPLASVYYLKEELGFYEGRCNWKKLCSHLNHG